MGCRSLQHAISRRGRGREPTCLGPGCNSDASKISTGPLGAAASSVTTTRRLTMGYARQFTITAAGGHRNRGNSLDNLQRAKIPGDKLPSLSRQLGDSSLSSSHPPHHLHRQPAMLQFHPGNRVLHKDRALALPVCSQMRRQCLVPMTMIRRCFAPVARRAP